jgi:hypothetical protein
MVVVGIGERLSIKWTNTLDISILSVHTEFINKEN